MNVFQNIFSKSKDIKDTPQLEADQLLTYVISLINREDLISDLINKYEEVKLYSRENRETAYIPIYIGLESFIAKNRPLIIKFAFTKEQLREDIRKRFDIAKFNSNFRLLFLPEIEQNALIYEIAATKIGSYVVKNIGQSRLRELVSTLKSEISRNLIVVNEQGLNFEALNADIQKYTEEDIKQAFGELYDGILKMVSNSLDRQITDKILLDIFDDIKKMYDYEIISIFLDIIPEGYLESERISRLSRYEIEKKIDIRTHELLEARKQLEQKLELINKQNEDLTKAQEALQSSLTAEKQLEDELKKEKEKIEEKVTERTAQLEQKTNELNTAMNSLQTSFKQTGDEKARLLASINNLSLGFLMTDGNDKIIALNRTLIQLLNSHDKIFATMEELSEFLNIGSVFLESFQKCKDEKKLQKVAEIKFNKTYFSLFFTPIIINNDNCIGAVVLFEDISEAKLLDRAKDEFFAVASHELRTPLTAIRGYSALILENFPDQLNENKPLSSMIMNIHKSALRLINIVNDFLDASKLEQGKVALNMQSVTLSPIIDGVIADVSQLVTANKIYLTFEKSNEELPPVYADPDKIKQVLINLVGNAIKFTHEGGITITVLKESDHVKVCIKDTGLGVSEDYRQLLFRKFQQAGERILTRDASTGSGMGLYISKLLMEAMNGTISLDATKLGEGSTFSFSLPIAQNN